jgi:superfamily II DNA or RNA helicase
MLDYIEEVCDDVAKITGEVKDDLKRGISDRADAIAKVESGQAKILAGTQSIFSEGVSIPILSCIILAVPTNNAPLLEQLIARVQRIMPGKEICVAVDIKLKGNTGFRHRNTRKGVYIKLGYPMTDYDLGKLVRETSSIVAENN